MFNKKIEDAIIDQINYEMYSGYIYLSMASYFESVNLKGFANWMRIQVQEENFHAMKMFDFVLERGGRPLLKAIGEPKNDWKDAIECFKVALEHEESVTSRINNLLELAVAEKDHATANFLQWYVAEQVEEESSVSEILEQLKMIDGKGSGMFMIDKELKARVFTPPVAGE